MKLMADNYEDDHLKTAPDQTNHKPSPDQVAEPNHQLFIPDSLCKRSAVDWLCLSLTRLNCCLSSEENCHFEMEDFLFYNIFCPH